MAPSRNELAIKAGAANTTPPVVAANGVVALRAQKATLGVPFVALIALVALPYLALLVVIFFSGATIIGSQTGANAACGKLYPARMRTSAIGWALGIGRLGGIAAAPLGGFLLVRGLAPKEIFLSACAFALIASNSACVIVPPSSSFLADSISPAGPPALAVLRT